MSSTTFMFVTFSAEIIYCFKILFEVVIFGNSNFKLIKTKSHKKMTKIKIVELKKLCNFIVDNFFI